MINQISATIIADSKNEFGNRLTTYLLVFPRIILAELNTHRMFSRNSASSRAIPFEKMMKTVEETPFIPMAWQKDHKGMQGVEYITDEIQLELNINAWLNARDNAISSAKYLNHGVHAEGNVTKQICNRLLEPFMYHTAIVSATEFENFFAQRCPRYETYENKIFRSKKDCIKGTKGLEGIDPNDPRNAEAIGDILYWLEMNKGQAEIHIMDLAEKMWDAYNESSSKLLKAGEWHIPYEDKIKELFDIDQSILDLDGIPASVKVGIVMAARTSYTTVGNELSDWSLAKYCQKVDELAKADPIHASPFEHCATAMDKEEYHWLYGGSGGNKNGNGWCGNFKGFIQFRKMLPNENITK